MEYARKLKFHKEVDDPNKVLEILNSGSSIKNIYFLCINRKTNNLIDIIETTEFTKQIWSLRDYIIIGIAKGKKNSFILAKDIIEEYYLKNNSLVDFRKQYILRKRR